MAEKVARTGVKRDNNNMYYIKFDNSGGAVMSVPRKQPGQTAKGKPAKVVAFDGQRDTQYIYFLDKDGDVARAKRAIGGQKRKASAGRSAAKKTAARKPAAKKAGGAKKGGAAKKGAAKAKKGGAKKGKKR